jgi:hypothetical protein
MLMILYSHLLISTRSFPKIDRASSLRTPTL